MTVTCPSCGFSFETVATTNTRCRSCRKVVTIGRSPSAQLAKATHEDYDEPPAGTGWVVAALAGAAFFIIWLSRRGT
jgi:hypothetical protein